jgi:hypothetical protein
MNPRLPPRMVLPMVDAYASARVHACQDVSLEQRRRAHVFMAWVSVRLSPRRYASVDVDHWALRAWSHLRVARELRRLSRKGIFS